MTAPRQVLIVAGLDPSGGAGLLADARVVAEHGLRAVGVVTALTEQDTSGVRAVHASPAEVVAAQLAALLSDLEVAAVKLGMLASEPIARVVAEVLALTDAPVVWDPVLLPTRGQVPLYAGELAAARELLAPHVTVATPNLAEVAALTGAEPPADPTAMHVAAAMLRAAGLDAVMVTGGHLEGDAVDVLIHAGGSLELAATRVRTFGPVHGTGCVLSSALAAGLACGNDLESAARGAKDYVGSKLAAAFSPGRGMAVLV
jgi:hydroxymethylpyrimidine/phosphomethylpyrimidine kinase